jgi:hypothetical protein
MSAKRKAVSSDASSATIGFEAKLWLAADKLRNNIDATEYTFRRNIHPDLRADGILACDKNHV